MAYFDALNAQGGIDGRKVVVDTCDDGGYGVGDEQCVHKLIDGKHVFAFAGNSIYDYAGASCVSLKDVPDIGGEPISTAYDQYPHLYSIGGSNEPRNGTTIGWNGKLYGGAGVYASFKQKVGAHIAGVVYYNQASSPADTYPFTVHDRSLDSMPAVGGFVYDERQRLSVSSGSGRGSVGRKMSMSFDSACSARGRRPLSVRPSSRSAATV